MHGQTQSESQHSMQFKNERIEEIHIERKLTHTCAAAGKCLRFVLCL